MTRRRRQGFTLVEVALFAALGLGLLGMVWELFTSSMTKGSRAEAKLQAVQACQLFALHLERDLENLYEPVHFGHAQEQIRFAQTASETVLEISVFGVASQDQSWDPLPLDRIRYRFEKLSGRIFRQKNSEPVQVLSGRYGSWNLRISPLDQAGVPHREAPALVYSLVGLPHIYPNGKAPDRSEISVLFGGVPRAGASDAQAYPDWNPVPYGRPRPLEPKDLG